MPFPTRPFRARPRVTARSLAGALALSSALLLNACDIGAAPGAPTAASVTGVPTAAPVELTSTEILQLARPSLVLLDVTFPTASGSGTGFVVAVEGETAIIVTNAHVVAGSTSQTATPAGTSKKLPARVIGISHCDDLAVLEVDGVSGLTPVTFASNAQVPGGAKSFAVGFPLNGGPNGVGGSEPNIVPGEVSQPSTSAGQHPDVVLHGAPITHGYSGSPLFDAQGRVIGVNTFSKGTAVNYAIGSDYTQRTIKQLRADGSQQWLGLNFQSLVTDDGTSLTVVGQVDVGSPGARVGLQARDLVLAIDGQPTPDVAMACQVLRSRADGQQVLLDIIRLSDSAPIQGQAHLTIGQPGPDDRLVWREDEPSATPASQSSSELSAEPAGALPPNMAEIVATIGFDPQRGVVLDYQPGPVTLVLNQNDNRGGYAPIKGDVSDFVLHTDVVWGESSHQCEVYSRTTDGGGYDIFLRSDGAVVAGWLDNGTWRFLGEASSQAINTAPGARNNLVVAARGTRYTVYVNGQQVLTFEHAGEPRGGVYLWAWDAKGPNAAPVESCSYSETWLWALAP